MDESLSLQRLEGTFTLAPKNRAILACDDSEDDSFKMALRDFHDSAGLNLRFVELLTPALPSHPIHSSIFCTLNYSFDLRVGTKISLHFHASIGRLTCVACFLHSNAMGSVLGTKRG